MERFIATPSAAMTKVCWGSPFSHRLGRWATVRFPAMSMTAMLRAAKSAKVCFSPARAVFFHRLGEIQDRSYENPCYRASGLNLVVAAITLWNTVYLEKAIEALRQHENVDEGLLPHIFPLVGSTLT